MDGEVDRVAVAAPSRMDVVRPEFRPDPTLDRAAMEAQQREIATAATFQDDVVSPDRIGSDGEDVVVGVDQAFRAETAVSVAVAVSDGVVIDQATGRASLTVPYIPGLLAYREAPPIIEALSSLAVDPDVVFFDGSGRIHYRQAGIAVHVGVLFDVPAVGVAKNLLCGTPGRAVDTPLKSGARVPVEADDSVEPVVTGDDDWPTIGYVHQTRQYANPDRRHINPVYVSSGHRVTAGTAVDLVEATVAGHKLPEPIHVADREVNEVVTED